MGGFNISGGDGPSNTIETLRAHRWVITKLGPISQTTLQVARDVNLPQMRIERQEVLGGLIWYRFAKSVKFEDVEVVFYDTSGVLKDVEAWKALVWTPESGIQQHTTYKKDCIFSLASGGIKETITLKYAWPAAISHSRLSYTNSEIKQVNLILAYDWAESTSSG